IEFIGLNHFVFGRNVYVKGENRTQEVLNNLANNELDYCPANIISLGWSKTFIESDKLLPNLYHEYYIQMREVLAKDIQAYEEHGTGADEVRELETPVVEIYNSAELAQKPEEVEERGGDFYSNVACSLKDSIHNDKKDIQTVNTLNNGAIPSLPNDAVIEVNCVITKHGPKPVS